MRRASAFRAFDGAGWRFARAGDLKDADAIVDEELERLLDARPRGPLEGLDAVLKIAFFFAAALAPGVFFSLAVPSADEPAMLLGLIALAAGAAAGVWAIGRRAERDFADAAEKLGLSRVRAREFYASFGRNAADDGE